MTKVKLTINLKPREGGNIGLFNTLPFLFVGLTTLGTFIESWFVYSVECPNVSTINCNLQKG